MKKYFSAMTDEQSVGDVLTSKRVPVLHWSKPLSFLLRQLRTCHVDLRITDAFADDLRYRVGCSGAGLFCLPTLYR
jgi:hypothetical protein